jgi:hypothetical protein
MPHARVTIKLVRANGFAANLRVMKKNYITPGLMLIPVVGNVGPNVGSPNGNDADLQPELSPDEQDDLENGGGW